MKFAVLLALAIVAVTKNVEGANELPPEVTLPDGKLRGKIERSRSGRRYYSFHRVPYGHADRFELPSEPKPWIGTYDAAVSYDGCAQSMWITNETLGVEDCLTLHITTPGISEAKLPVIVYFHGGGFTIGGGEWYHGGNFVDRDVILVAPGYRLGALGFLSTGDGVFPENLGLKDQVMALKWVQKNIARFGGDPNRVTIAGGSAGGASVSYHILSPLSKGLFQRAISLSGTYLNPWALSRNPKAMARKYAELLNCPAFPSQKLLECLKLKPIHDIVEAIKEFTQWGYDPFTPFGPVVETTDSGDAKFLPEDPEVAFTAGRFNKAPWMVGITEDEGIMMHAGYIFQAKGLLDDIAKNWKKIFPITFEYDHVYTDMTQEQQDRISEKVYQYYFQDRKINQDTWQQLTNAFSDRLFNNGVKKAIMLAGKHTDMWAYIFSEDRSDYSSLNLLGFEKVRPGVGHADDLSFLFNDFHIAPAFEPGSVKETVSKNAVDLFSSFAQFGKPTAMWKPQLKWDPVSTDELSSAKPIMYYKIAAESALVPEHFTERYNFWESVLYSNTGSQHQEL